MARFRYQHIKSSVEGKAPTAAQLKVAEIGVNDFAGDEKLFIKNSSGDVVDFPRGYSREYIDDNERVIAEALNDLNSRKMDSSAYTEIWESGTGKGSAVLKGSSGTASGDYSVAEGQQTSGTGIASHAEGGGTNAHGNQSHAEGAGTIASGACSHAEGQGAQANGLFSHAEGSGTIASGQSSHAEGNYTRASGNYSHAEGQSTTASGNYSHAEGAGTTASGNISHAEGTSTIASGSISHAEGQQTVASGMFSHSEGASTHANGDISHAEGGGTSALTDYSHAEGMNTIASGISSHAEGVGTNANGNQSHTEGMFTTANNQAEHASGQYNISSSASTTFGDSGNTLFSVGNGTASDARHNAFEIRQNGDIYIVNKDGDDVRLQDEIGNIDVDQVIDETTSASTNPVSTSAVYKAVTDNELVWTNAFVVISGAISSHTEDTSIHVTSADKADWDAKLDASDVEDFFDDAKYELSGTTHVINFYNGNTIKATIDATDFIKDGMIDSVSLETTGGTTYLVITWNTDAGKSQTSLNVGDLFDADNYYTKSQTSGTTELSTAFDAIDDLVGSGFTSSSITDVIIENERIVSEALNDLDDRKLDASAYTPTDLTNYYTKSQTSGATEISTALSGKLSTSEYATFSAATNASINDLSGQSETIAAALNDLNGRKLDASAYTPTDLSNYYTKSETSGATELTTAFSAKADKTSDLDGVKLKKITQSAYDALVQAGTVDPNTLYIITD